MIRLKSAPRMWTATRFSFINGTLDNIAENSHNNRRNNEKNLRKKERKEMTEVRIFSYPTEAERWRHFFLNTMVFKSLYNIQKQHVSNKT